MSRRVTTFAVVLSLLLSVAPTARVDACRPPLEVVFFEGHVGTILLTPSGKIFIVDANVPAAGLMVRYLRDRGLKEIDAILVTHPHGDHFAGVPRLVRTFKVKRLIDNGYLASSLAANTPDTRARRNYKNTVVGPFKARGGKHVTDVKAGQRIALDGELEVSLLGPRKQGYRSAITEARLTNKHTIAVFVRHGDVGIMLPGDAPDDTQASIADDFPKETRETDVILLPHHGRYYGDAGFARKVGAENPKARVGVASRDATGPTLAKWRSAGLKLYHTDAQGGDVTIASTGKDFTVSAGKGKQRKDDHFAGR
jgi:competence protein ComEC